MCNFLREVNRVFKNFASISTYNTYCISVLTPSPSPEERGVEKITQISLY